MDQTEQIISDILEIQTLLKYEAENEAEKLHQSNKTDIVDTILKYEVAFTILENFAREKNISAFYLTFQEYDINIDNIRKCFRESESKRKVNHLYARICQNVVEILKNK